MAKQQKTQPPLPITIDAPKALIPLMQAFHVDSEKAAKLLVKEVAKAIYGAKDIHGTELVMTKAELDGITSLIRDIAPKDTLETLYAAQIVVSHMLGMKKLAEVYREDQKLGINLLNFSNEAIQRLGKKRTGGTQNITVNYNHNGQGNALIQTVIANKGA